MKRVKGNATIGAVCIGFIVGSLVGMFSAMKFAGLISWSWWWVLSPILIAWAIQVMLGLIFLIWLVGKGK